MRHQRTFECISADATVSAGARRNGASAGGTRSARARTHVEYPTGLSDEVSRR